MDENYRLFFNIKPLQLEAAEEESDAKGKFEDKEMEDVEYEEELGEDSVFEDRVLEKELYAELEPDKEESTVDGKSLTMRTEEHVDAKRTQTSKVLHGSHRAAVTISVLSAFRPASQLSIPELIQYESESYSKSDSESVPQLALFLQSLEQSEQAECHDETQSEVCIMLLKRILK
jgi:hypothetical protein